MKGFPCGVVECSKFYCDHCTALWKYKKPLNCVLLIGEYVIKEKRYLHYIIRALAFLAYSYELMRLTTLVKWLRHT